jgi:hypothetical protein
MKLEVSIGEAIDKMTILDIKKKNITNPDKQANVIKENDYIVNELRQNGYINLCWDEIIELREINQTLWDIEDKIREKESKKQFDSEFIELARSVYITNDERFEVKKRINEKCNSNFKEEKSYAKYN